MNDNDIIELLRSMRGFGPRRDILISLKKRVFDAIPTTAGAPVVSPIRPARSLSPVSGSVFAALCVAFTVVLVVVNQLPMHGAYQDSIASIVEAQQLADTLNQSKTPASTALAIQAATEKTRATLDTLKLKGVLGVYTSAQCLNAYAIYDSYLDHLGDYLDRTIPTINDPSTRAAFKDLRAYVQDSRQEVRARVHLYSSRQ